MTDNSSRPTPPLTAPSEGSDSPPAAETIPEGWTVHSFEINGVDRYYLYNAAEKKATWKFPVENNNETIAESGGLSPWQRNQNAFIKKYYDKATGGFGPQKLEDDHRYKDLAKEK